MVLAAAPEILDLGGQLVVVGSGERDLEEGFEALRREHPTRVFRHPFDEIFVRPLYAASDFLLMPSRFEPCGLSQMMAQRYGSLPIASVTGDPMVYVSGGAEHQGPSGGGPVAVIARRG